MTVLMAPLRALGFPEVSVGGGNVRARIVQHSKRSMYPNTAASV